MQNFPLLPLHSLIQQLTPYHPVNQDVVCSVHAVKYNAILETASHWWSLIYSTVPFNMNGTWIISTQKISELKSITQNMTLDKIFLPVPSPASSESLLLDCPHKTKSLHPALIDIAHPRWIMNLYISNMRLKNGICVKENRYWSEVNYCTFSLVNL